MSPLPLETPGCRPCLWCFKSIAAQTLTALLIAVILPILPMSNAELRVPGSPRFSWSSAKKAATLGFKPWSADSKAQVLLEHKLLPGADSMDLRAESWWPLADRADGFCLICRVDSDFI